MKQPEDYIALGLGLFAILALTIFILANIYN